MASDEDVRGYYESVGWSVGPTGELVDTEVSVATRPTYRAYHAASYERLAAHLAPGGRLLDVGAGAVPHESYRNLYTPFELAVCVDISVQGLRVARSQASSTPMAFVCADAQHLPFRPAAFSSVLCLHVLYHLNRRAQQAAVAELLACVDGGDVVVVYSTRATPLTRLAGLVRRVRRRSARTDGQAQGVPEPRLFVEVQPIDDLVSRVASTARVEVSAWRVLDTTTAGTLLPRNRIGDTALGVLARLERRWPRALLPVARYPLVRLRRRPGAAG
jgi:SAM-dependent methyltransferase